MLNGFKYSATNKNSFNWKKKKKKVLNGLFFAYLDVVHIKRKRKVKTKKEGFIP
jgi:hypothetical protein